MVQSPTPQPQFEPVDLKDPYLAAFLAWLLPGLGHYYQGRRMKAAIYFVFIMGTFAFGVYLGGSSKVGWGRAVYASWQGDDKRLYYLCQVGVGLPAMPALVQTYRVRHDKAPLLGGFMAPPRPDEDFRDLPGQPTISALQKHLHRYFELGTVYTAIAGLLNILAVYDAWAGPVVFVEGKKEDDEESPPADDDTAGEKS